MRIDPESVPVLGRAYRLGIHPVTTTIVVIGPLLIGLVAVVGRNPLTIGLGIAYVLSLPASVAYFRLAGIAGDESEETPDEAEDGDRDDEENGEGGDEEARDADEDASEDGSDESEGVDGTEETSGGPEEPSGGPEETGDEST